MRTYTCDRCGKSDNSTDPDIRIYTTCYMQLTHPGYGGAPDWSMDLCEACIKDTKHQALQHKRNLYNETELRRMMEAKL